MTRLLKYFSAFAVMVISAITLVSCSGYNFYKTWTDAGADIDKDHIFEVISIDEAKEKIEADETFVLVLGSPDVSAAPAKIQLLQEQAEYFEFDGKLYFIDVTKSLETPSGRKTVKETLGIYETVKAAANIVIVCYTNGDITLDTSCKVTNKELENFVSSESIDYYKVAAYLFNDFIYK